MRVWRSPTCVGCWNSPEMIRKPVTCTAGGYTMELNQVEQEKTYEKVMPYKPKNITELASFVATVCPTFKSMLPIFLDRRHFDYGISVFDRLIQIREMFSSFIRFQE